MVKIGMKISQGYQNLDSEMVSKELGLKSPETKPIQGPLIAKYEINRGDRPITNHQIVTASMSNKTMKIHPNNPYLPIQDRTQTNITHTIIIIKKSAISTPVTLSPKPPPWTTKPKSAT